jgi:hypothetical protein
MIGDWTMETSVQLCVILNCTASITMMTGTHQGFWWNPNPIFCTILVVIFSTISVTTFYKILFQRAKGLALETPHLPSEPDVKEMLRHTIL